MSTGSEPFSLLVRLYATVFVLPSVLILIETICPKICSKSRLNCAKSPFPVDVRRSKTSLLKLPNVAARMCYSVADPDLQIRGREGVGGGGGAVSKKLFAALRS